MLFQAAGMPIAEYTPLTNKTNFDRQADEAGSEMVRLNLGLKVFRNGWLRGCTGALPAAIKSGISENMSYYVFGKSC